MVQVASGFTAFNQHFYLPDGFSDIKFNNVETCICGSLVAECWALDTVCELEHHTSNTSASALMMDFPQFDLLIREFFNVFKSWPITVSFIMTILKAFSFTKLCFPTQAIYDLLLLGHELIECLLLLFFELLVVNHYLLSILLVLATADLFARLYIQLEKFLETIDIQSLHVLLVTRQISLQVALV